LAEQQHPAPSTITASGPDQRNLLVLNAIPADMPPGKIPAGELAGAFSVSPNPNSGTTPGGTSANGSTGTGIRGTGTSGSGSGSKSGPGSGTGSGEGGTGPGGGGTGNGSGSGTGSGSGSGHNPGNGFGPGEGAGSGSGPGNAPGHGSGTVGLPGASGNGPYTGVSIAGAAPSVKPSNAAPRLATPHGLYGITVVATSSTGGGLRDFGVFKNETVYTVYVEMTEAGHPRANWTLQYATVGTLPSAPANAVLVPPFPSNKEYPRLPQEASARNIGRMLVVAGVISKDGTINSLRVIQSPNPLLIKPLLDCLAKWTFQAAEFNGEQIAVKFVMGIPISADLMEGK
jgi:TonB-like protein